MKKIFDVMIIDYDGLTEDEKEDASDNGSGKESANYIRIVHKNKTILLESDAMENEDAEFTRSLKWIKEALEVCYRVGKEETS